MQYKQLIAIYIINYKTKIRAIAPSNYVSIRSDMTVQGVKSVI